VDEAKTSPGLADQHETNIFPIHHISPTHHKLFIRFEGTV